MKQRFLVFPVLVGSVLMLGIGCGKSDTPVVTKPDHIAPMPGADGVKSGRGATGPGQSTGNPTEPIPVPK